MQETKEQLELDKLRQEIENISADTERLLIETKKLERERRFYPLVVATGLVFAFVGLVRLLS